MLSPLAINGTYQVTVIGDLRDTGGRSIEFPKGGGIRLLDGQFSPVVETVSLGNTAVGGFHMADNDTAFASFETIATGDNGQNPRYLISTASANSSGFWTNQELVYLGPEDTFKNEIQTGGIVANGSRAVLPIAEGRLNSIFNFEPGITDPFRSADIKAFPGRFPLGTDLVEWPEITISANTETKYRVDLGTAGSPLSGLHASFQAQYFPIEAEQINSSSSNSHFTLAAWWAWTNPVDNDFKDFGVFFNTLETPIAGGSVPSDWQEVGAPISGSDRSVGWPYLSSWESGRAVVLWNDAADDASSEHVVGRENVFKLEVPSYGLMVFDPNAGGAQVVDELIEPGNPNISRATDIEAFDNNSVLIVSVVDSNTVGARIITLDSQGQIVGPVAAIELAPGPGLPIEMKFINSSIPQAGSYANFRRLENEGPKAVRLDGDRFVVSWIAIDSSSPDTQKRQILALYNAKTNRWANSFVDLTSEVSNPGDLTDFSIKVDRLGFTTFLWEENAFGSPTVVIGRNLNSLRSSQSILDVDFDATSGPGSLASIFENTIEVELAATENDPNHLIQVRGNVFSEVSRSGQFIVGWGERVISLPDNIATNNGTKARRFQHDMVTGTGN